jgi:PRTRC genetic system protein C
MIGAAHKTILYDYVLAAKAPAYFFRSLLEDVRGVLALQYPVIATATISGPEPVGDTMRYTFERAIEIRGAFAFFV